MGGHKQSNASTGGGGGGVGRRVPNVSTGGGGGERRVSTLSSGGRAAAPPGNLMSARKAIEEMQGLLPKIGLCNGMSGRRVTAGSKQVSNKQQATCKDKHQEWLKALPETNSRGFEKQRTGVQLVCSA